MKCKRCEVDKKEEDFYKGRKICKKCSIALIKQWKKENNDKVKASQAKCRKINADKINEQQKKYREANPDKIKESARKYREANREKCRERCLRWNRKVPNRSADYRKDHLDKCNEYSRKYREKNREEINRKNNEKRKVDRVHATPQGKARKAVYMAIKRGKLVRAKKCQICNKECKPEAHHANYSQPLIVLWVCRSCHGMLHTAEHKRLREEQNPAAK